MKEGLKRFLNHTKRGIASLHQKAALPTLFALALIIGGSSAAYVTKVRTPAVPKTEEREPLTLTFLLNGEPNAILPKGDADFVRKTIEDKFNVRLEVTNVPVIDAQEKTNLLIASGATPDFFMAAGSVAQDYSDLGILADLTPYLNPRTMPNYFKWVTPEFVQAFQMPGVYNMGPIVISSKSFFSYFIRKDWLDKLGLKLPTDYEELSGVMRAFTRQDPDGNGKNDTYGFSAPGNGNSVHYSFPQFKNYGLIGTTFVDPSGDYHDSATDPLIAPIFDDLRVWLKEGLVDPDWYLSNEANVGDKFAQGKIGMVWVLHMEKWAFESEPTSYFNQLKKLYPDAEVIPFNPYPGQPVWVKPYPTVPWMISRETAEQSPEKVERIIEIVDWLAGEEGYLLAHYGLEGKHYIRNGNEITIVPEAYQTDMIDKGNFLAIWGFLTPREPSRIGLKEIDPRLTERDRTIRETVAAMPLGQGNGLFAPPPAGISITAFRAKANELASKLLLDERDSSNWPQYRATLMEQYKGKLIFQEYIKKMRLAGIEVNSEFH